MGSNSELAWLWPKNNYQTREEGIIDKNIVPRIAAAQKHAEDLQNLPGAPRLTDIMPLEKMLIESCGEEATLIHTGRSRQDMFTTLNEARLRLAVLDFYPSLTVDSSFIH